MAHGVDGGHLFDCCVRSMRPIYNVACVLGW